MKKILSRTEQQDHAGIFSAIYLISYAGATIPNLAVSYLAKYFNLFQISLGYATIVGLAWIFVFKKKKINYTKI